MSSLTNERYPKVNGREMKNEEDVKIECARRGHDLICPKSWYRLMQVRGCVKTFSGLEPNTEYESVRSEEMAYRIHMEKMEKGVMDLDTPGINWMCIGVGVGTAGIGVGFFFAGVGCLVNSFKK
jgi:hypothetical protein